MGHIYDDFGRFAIEGRSESFYIHADYGYAPMVKSLASIPVGYCYRDSMEDEPMQVISQHLGFARVKPATRSQMGDGDRVNTRDEDGALVMVIPVGDDYRPLDQMADDHPLGNQWINYPHPEIENDDLDDLIRALEDYRNHI